ncbi:hypothetical protein PQX77_020480 [Marasmius sp. AFHP31]|nr:hypothetical protein PQX77_020480 [Marasmius sp. AFHP31]
MASPQSQQNYEPHSFSWYWDDDHDYDLKEVTSRSNQNYRKQSGRKEGSLLQTLAYPRTDWGHERQLTDSAVLVVHGDSTEYEQRWSESDELDLGCLSIGELYLPMKPVPKQTRRTVRAEDADGNRLSPSEPRRHVNTHPELEFQKCPCEDSGSTSLDSIIIESCSHSLIPSLSPPSSSTTSSTKHKPSLTLALAAAAFDESRPHGSSIPLPQHSHYYTCEGKTDMLFDQRQRRRDKRERTIGREAEVERGATSRFLQFPFRLSLRASGARASQDMESIWEEDERAADLGYKSSTKEEAVDGDERGRSGQSRSSYTNGGRTSGEHGYRNGCMNGGYSYSNGGRGRAGSGGGGRDDEDDDERRNSGDHLDYYFSQHFSSSEEEDDSEDEDSDSEEGGGNSEVHHTSRMSHSGQLPRHNQSGSNTRTGAIPRPSDARVTHQHQTSSSPESNSEEDDVPLAKSHPTALRAQQSIRIKDRQRRKERKLEKAQEKAARNKQAAIKGNSGANGANIGSALGVGGMSSTQEAMLHASIPVSGPSAPYVTPISSFATAKPLKHTSTTQNSTAFPASPHHSSPPVVDKTTLPPSVPAGTVRLRARMGRGRTTTISGENPPNAAQGGSVPPVPATPSQNLPPHHSSTTGDAPVRTLRPMRSFHKPNLNQQGHQEWHASSPPVPAPAPATASGLTRSHTRGRSQSNAHPHTAAQMMATKSAPPLPPQPPAATTTSARSRSRPPPIKSPYPTDEFGALAVNQAEPLARRSTESRRGGRSSSEHPREKVEVPPVELMPPLPQLETQQLRVYISTKQRFVMVEITSMTNAGDVIGMVKAKGGLPDVQFGTDAGEGAQGVGWVVWELNADLGLERPIRAFEQLVEVQGSWNKEKTENAFMIKWTPGWEKMLRREAIPAAAPTYSGYLEYEVRRGKWNKRWLVLKDHCLFISKRDNCKDQTLLASLSNFDIYHFIHPPSKTPKEYTFGIKSTDKMSLFEDTNDYMHIFCTREGEGEKWMQRIRIARSYVLYQERNVLFAPPPSQAVPMSAPATSGGGLGRSMTTKRRVPAQPLVQVAEGNVFAKGSLLRSQV